MFFKGTVSLMFISNVDDSKNRIKNKKEININHQKITIQRLPIVNILVKLHPFLVFLFNTFILNLLLTNLFFVINNKTQLSS